MNTDIDTATQQSEDISMQKLEKEAMENCHDVSWPRCNEVPYQRFLAFAALLISCWRMPAVHIKKRRRRWS